MSNSHLQDTPTSRSTQRRPSTADGASRVKGVCPHGNRCLVENCLKGINYSHLVPRALGQIDKLMTKLEWYWGMTHRTLNLDTRFNVFPCGGSLHISHDAFKWGLLPPDDIITQYHNSLTKVGSRYYAERSNFLNIPNGHFFYRFLPLHSLENETLSRQVRVPTGGNDRLGPGDVQVHYFPFDNMPLLKSHLHPKFAIFELGRQISDLPMDTKINLVETTPILDLIMDIHRAWSETLPVGFLKDEDFNPISGGDDDSDEDGDEDAEFGGDGDDPNDEDYSEGTIPRRDGKRTSAMPPSPSGRSKRPRPAGKTTGNALRVIRKRVPSIDVPLRVKEWVDQLASEAQSNTPSPPFPLGSSPPPPCNIDTTRSPSHAANGCITPLDASDAETLFEIASQGRKRHCDGDVPIAKKRKISLVELQRQGSSCTY